MATSGGMCQCGGFLPNIYSFMLKMYIVCIVLSQIVLTISLKAELYTSQSFDLIRASSYPHFVMFYAPWCGHCKRIQPLWDKFAAENHKLRRMKVAKVDCTETTPLCAAENIKAYPTFLLFNNQEKFTFRGNRDISDFTEFVNNKVTELKDGQVPVDQVTIKPTDGIKKDILPEDNKPVLPKVLSKETFQEEVDFEYTFVDFYAPWCSHCLKLEPIWNKLADTLRYNKKVTIAKVDCTAEPELCQSHNINGYPTLNFYRDGYLITQYQQGRSLASFVSFIHTQLSSDGDNGGPEPDDPTVDEPHHPVAEDIEVVLSEETYKEMMSRVPHLIYFHDSGPQFSNMDLLIFEQVQHKLRTLNEGVSVAVLDCSKTAVVCQELNVNSFPSIVYFKSIEHFHRYYGIIDVEKIIEFVVKKNDEGAAQASKEEL